MFPWRFLSPLLACFSVGVFFWVCVCVGVWSGGARGGGEGGEEGEEGRVRENRMREMLKR